MKPKIRRIKVKTFMERLYCECGTELQEGKINIPKRILSTNPTPTFTYTHSCASCWKSDTRATKYPKLVYKEVLL